MKKKILVAHVPRKKSHYDIDSLMAGVFIGILLIIAVFVSVAAFV